MCLLSSSLRRKSLNRVILAQLTINSIRNKFNLLAEGIKGKVDVLIISETKIDETFRSRQFYIEGFTHLTGLIETWNDNTNYIVCIIVP